MKTERKKKLELVNLFQFCDGSTDKSVTELEVILVVFVDPETNLLVMQFFEVTAPETTQDASGLQDVIVSTFKKHGLESVLGKMIVLFSDSAPVTVVQNQDLVDHPLDPLLGASAILWNCL